MQSISVAFLGNQDNTAVFLADCVKEITNKTLVVLFEEEIANLRCAPAQVGASAQDSLYHLISFQNKTQINETIKLLNEFDMIIVTGNLAPIVASQLNKPICYVPVGAYELNKFLTQRKFSLNNIRKLQKKFALGFVKATQRAIQDHLNSKRLHIFKDKVVSVTSLGQGGVNLKRFTQFCHKIFKDANQLICPEPMPKFDFIRSHYDKTAHQKFYAKYSQYDVVIIAPSRKWIEPDAYTGFTKRTDWILKAFDQLADNECFTTQKHKIIWLDHGPHAELCKQHINDSAWRELVDFYPHLDSTTLWAMFKMSNTVVLDAFGDNCYPLLNGALREALAFSTPVLTSNFDPVVEPYQSLYNCAPIGYCAQIEELVSQLHELLTNSAHFFANKQEQMNAWEVRYNPTKKLEDNLNAIFKATLG